MDDANANGTFGFLAGGGELGRLIAAFDWAATPLGSDRELARQPAGVLAMALRAPVPIAFLWGTRAS